MGVVAPLPPRLPALLAIIDEWTAAGVVVVRLDPETQGFQFRGNDRLADWQRGVLEDLRPSFTEALRWRAGICIRCGSDPVKRPSAGRRRVYDAEGVGTGWEDALPRPGVMPALWCSSCYERGAWEAWSWGVPMKGGPRAHSKAKGEDDGLFDGIEEPVPGEACLF